MLDLVPRRPRFEGPVVVFVVAALTVYALGFWLAWSGFAAQELLGDEAAVEDTGFGC